MLFEQSPVTSNMGHDTCTGKDGHTQPIFESSSKAYQRMPAFITVPLKDLFMWVGACGQT